MSNYDEPIHVSVGLDAQRLVKENIEKKTFLNYFSIALATFGVGFIPLAPGTWGSAVGVAIYLFFRRLEEITVARFSAVLTETQITAWIHVANLILFFLLCLSGVWASGKAAEIFNDKDPQKVVVDEVMGQLLVFLFIPFDVSWKFVLAGFILFRLFDIWKPYPIDSLQNLPAGIGVCADDILAGVYGGICLALIYAVSLTI